MDTRKSRRSPPPMAAGVATVPALNAGRSTGAHRLLLRVYAAEHLRGVSSHGTYCKVYVGNVDMAASRKGRQSFKRFLLATSLSSSSSSSSTASTPSSSFSSTGGSSPDVLESEMPATQQQENWSASHHNASARSARATGSGVKGLDTTGARVREFKTQVHKFSRASPVWNEKFEVPGVDAARDLVSIRVKSARLMSSPAVGACCFPLRDLADDETVDRWVDLLDGKKPAGRIRVQLRLVSIEPRAHSVVKKESRHRHRSGGHSSSSHGSRSHPSDPVTDDDASERVGRSSARRGSSQRSDSSNSSLSRTRLSGSVSPVAQPPPTFPSESSGRSSRRQSSRAGRTDTGTGVSGAESATQQQQETQRDSKRVSKGRSAAMTTSDALAGVREHVSETSSSRSSQSPPAQRPRGVNVVTAAPEVSATSSVSSSSTTSSGVYADLNEFTDDESEAVESTLASYDSFLRVRDRGTMLSEIGALSVRTHGSFVGSLHLYNRNSIATSTPSRTTMVMTEAEIAALSRESALAMRMSRRRPLAGGDSRTAADADDRLSGQTEYDDTASDDDDDEDSEPETEGPRIPWNSTITRLLTRKSTNILMDEDDDDEYDDDDDVVGDADDAGRPTDDIVPIMDFPGTPQDIDDIDCA